MNDLIVGVKYGDYQELSPHYKRMSGKYPVIIGKEFWHGHNWNEKKARIKSNRDFRVPKIERNMQRDKEVNR